MKRLLWLSNFSLANTGFGKATKEILTYLYQTGKYEICELASGISDLDPNVRRVPWKMIGVLPRTQEEVYRFNQVDEQVKRAFQYGLFRFDEAVFSFKPDIVVCLEDIWAWSGWLQQSKSWEKIKGRCVAAHPFDAEPMSEPFAVFLKEFKHIVTYTEWSRQIGIKAGLPQTQVIPLGVNLDLFKPLVNRKILRFQYGLRENDYVVLMVARNQIRKKFDALFESLHDIAKINPDLFNRIKIIPFTHWADHAGFEFARLFKSRNIPTNKIIAPYICDACKKYHLAEYSGEKKTCPSCKTKESCHTPTVISGLRDDQLNEIYNMSDLFVLPTSNEGFGQPLVEAKACEKITISTEYSSSGEISKGNGSGLTFDYSLYIEHNTLFYKANIAPYEIARKIDKAFRLKPEKAREMEQNARKLVIEKYSWKVIGAQWDNLLDKIDVVDVDWSLNQKTKNPNPDAELPQTPNPLDWICSLYKFILDVDVNEEMSGKREEHQGVKYWLWELQEKRRTKDEIEAFFRKIAQDDLAKRPIDLASLLNPSDVKRFLFVMPQSAGDNFLSTSVVAALHEKYPDYTIYVACKPEFASIWKNNPAVERVLPFVEGMLQYRAFQNRYTKGLFDFVLTPTILTQHNCNPNWEHLGLTQSHLINPL